MSNRNEYMRQYRNKHKERVANYARNSKGRKKEYYLEAKRNSNCSVCGMDDHRCLLYHHSNPDEKDKCVSVLAKSTCSIKRLQAEMDKCAVLCQNCHTIFHYEYVWGVAQ